jgi:hypothetical protein
MAQPPTLQYIENVSYFNQAALAYDKHDCMNFSSFYRNQWVSNPENMQHLGALYEGNLKSNKLGWGANYGFEQIKDFKNNDLGAALRYSIRFKNTSFLSFGTGINFYHSKKKNFDFNENNMLQSHSVQSALTYRIGVFYSSENLLLGVSVQNISEPDLIFLNPLYAHKLLRTFHFQSFYKFVVSRITTINPRLVALTSGTNATCLFSVLMSHYEKLYYAPSVRWVGPDAENVSFGLSLGYKFRYRYY